MHFHRSAFAALLIASAAFGATPATQPTTNPVDLENAAIAKLTAMPEPENMDVADAPLGPETTKYLDERKDVIAMLRQAGTMSNAVWPAITDDMSPVLKSLNGPRAAVNLLRLQAREDVAQGRPAAAVDDLLAGITIGRHIGQQKLLVSRLVEIGCEGASLEALAAALPKLPAEVVAALPARLDALTPAVPLAETIDAERAFGGLTLRRQMAMGGMGAPTTASPTTQAAATTQTGANALPPGSELVVKSWESVGPLYDAMKAASAAPPDEFIKVVDTAEAKLMANPWARILAPSFRSMRGVFAMTEAKQAMLRTAIDIQQHGPNAVAKSKDPFGKGPFTFTATADGFKLASALNIAKKGEPVSLQIGE